MEVCKGLLDVNPLLAFRQVPLPVQNFGHILADLVDGVLVGDKLVVHLLDEVGTAVAQLGQMQQCILEKRSISFCTRISNGVVMVPSSW